MTEWEQTCQKQILVKYLQDWTWNGPYLMLYSQLCYQKWKGGSNIHWWHHAGNRNVVKCNSGEVAMGSELAAVRMKMFSSWTPLLWIQSFARGRRWLAGWECVPLELSCCSNQSQHDCELLIHGKHHSVCIICTADQQTKGRFNVLVQGSFACQLESCVCLLSQGISEVQRRASQMSRGWKSLFYERRSSARFVSAARRWRWGVTGAQLRVWAFHSLGRGEIRPKVKDRAVHRWLQTSD